jgi:hypothetical protein
MTDLERENAEFEASAVRVREFVSHPEHADLDGSGRYVLDRADVDAIAEVFESWVLRGILIKELTRKG